MVFVISFLFAQLLSLLSFDSFCLDGSFSINKNEKNANNQLFFSYSSTIKPLSNNSNFPIDSKNEHLLFCEHCIRCSHINYDLKQMLITFNSTPHDLIENDYLFIYDPPHLQSAAKPPIPV